MFDNLQIQSRRMRPAGLLVSGYNKARRRLFSAGAWPLLMLCVALAGCRSETITPAAGSTSSDTGAENTTSTGSRKPSAEKTEGSLFDDLEPSDQTEASQDLPVEFPVLREVQHELGVNFVYHNGASARRLMNESISGGAAWLDFDRDGALDIYFVQGGNSDAIERPSNPTDVLYRAQPDGTYTEVQSDAGTIERRYSDGVSVGDFNDDGFDDLYISNVGKDRLLLNQGDGTFTDVSDEAGTINLLWASTSAWADLDGDSDLDLYVCNYVDYDPQDPIACNDDQGQPRTCHPDSVDPVPNCLFVNNGDGTFTECLKERGMDAPNSKSLGVVIADFNGDHSMDVFVANDTVDNHLFINDGQGFFTECGAASGCAFSGRGQYQASMGVAYGDYNRDGHWDLYVTHFTADSNTLYQGLSSGTFYDATRTTGLHDPTLAYLGFGTVMADLNCDGRTDLFIANGHVDDFYMREGDLWKMPAQLFTWNGKAWVEGTSQAGEYFRKQRLGRGVAVGDYNRDGLPELAVVNQNDKAAILQLESDHGHWLTIEFVGSESNRRGVGAVATVRQGTQVQRLQLAGGTSYCSGHEHRLFFGFGDNAETCDIEINWPSGRLQKLQSVAVDQSLTLYERDAAE